MFSAHTETALAEAYIYDDLDLEGDIESIFDFGDALLARLDRWREKVRLAGLLFMLPKGRVTIAGSCRSWRAIVTRAGATGRRSPFTMIFRTNFTGSGWTGGWFTRAPISLRLTTASIRRKNKSWIISVANCASRRDKKLLDLGCGWGGPILHAAKHFGVHATGITLSECQAAWARERIAADGAVTQVEVRLCDYRDLDPAQYDAIVSVRMAEHVGREQLSNYFAIARELLKPSGVFLNHAIGEGISAPAKAEDESFIGRYVFPDGHSAVADHARGSRNGRGRNS